MDRDKALEQAVVQIERQFGKGSIMRMGIQKLLDVPVISTGSIGLDVALGVGGVPRGRIVEIYGDEASGKTTLALHVAACAQKAGGMVAFIDAEHALNVNYAKKIGVDVDELLVSQPDTGEQALDIAEILIRSGAVDLVVIDSVAALVPKAELEGEMGDQHVGLQARLMSQAMRKLTGTISKSKTCVIFINQTRTNIGVMFGNPVTTTGGKALKFCSSFRMNIKKVGTIKEGNQEIGARVRVKVVKNKLAPPFKEAEFDIIFGEGISQEGEILDMATAMEIIEKSGAWYSFRDTRLGQGRENARRFLQENPDIKQDITQQIYARLGLGQNTVTETDLNQS